MRFLSSHGAQIFRATRRYTWPGEAAVVVSVVHIAKGTILPVSYLDGRRVSFISAFLTPGGIDTDPIRLAKNWGVAFWRVSLPTARASSFVITRGARHRCWRCSLSLTLTRGARR